MRQSTKNLITLITDLIDDKEAKKAALTLIECVINDVIDDVKTLLLNPEVRIKDDPATDMAMRADIERSLLLKEDEDEKMEKTE